MKTYIRALVLALITVSCSDDATDPDEQAVPQSQLTFLEFSSTNVISTRTQSFWAVKGQGRKLEMEYADGEDFLEFEVGGNSLLRAPDGRRYQNGDSVLITVTLDAANRMIANFEPSGLQFNPQSPAKLEINYARFNSDIDGDGRRDSRDERLEFLLRIWKQEQAGQPWIPQTTFRIDAKRIEARVLSFTGFAMAS